MERIVMVTGGSRGIGAATAVRAAARGYRVVVGYRERRDAADEVVRRCAEVGPAALSVSIDVADEASVTAAFSTVDAELGRLDALVHSAGIVARQSRVVDLDGDRIAHVLRVNVLGAFLCSREAVRRMSTARGGVGGVIVHVSSRAAVLGSAGEYVDYAASKAAVDTLTTGLAQEVAAEGVRVVAVRPGLIKTDIHASGGEPGRIERVRGGIPLGRGGEPDEVAAAIVWLLSDEASYITGAHLDVSGGR